MVGPCGLAHTRGSTGSRTAGSGVKRVTVEATNTRVVVELLCRARYAGPNAPQSGVMVSWYATLIDTIVDGKVVSEHAYLDPKTFAKTSRQAPA